MIDVIIPSWNKHKYLGKCLGSVKENTTYPYNLTVIDNGSDPPLEVEGAQVIRNEENLGFVKAINQGLKATEGDVVLLNNDTEVPEGWLEKMVECAKDARAGIVGVLSTSPDQYQYHKNFSFGSWVEAPQMVAFFCVLIKREVINKVGFLDEHIEVGLGDDDDYRIRARKEGVKIVISDVLVKHAHRTTVKEVEEITKIHKRNMAYLNRKHGLDQPSVLCAVLNQGAIAPELTNVLAKMSHDNRYRIKIYYPNFKPIANNRNKIVQKFLEEDWDYLLMIDSDVVPLNNPLNLVELDRDVIGLPCPQWNDIDPFPIYWVVMDYIPKEKGFKPIAPERREGLVEVDAVGTGAILIKRKVLKAVKAPFMRRWSKEGIQQMGLDFSFCLKAKEEGFSIWAHFDYPCRHYKNLDLFAILQIIFNQDVE